MLRRIRSLVSNSEDFFGVYDNVLSRKDCEILIDQFETSDNIEAGSTVHGLPYPFEIKNSLEVGCDFEDGSIISNIVRPALWKGINRYADQYTSLSSVDKWKYDSVFNFQKYDGENYGYFKWHTEHCSKYPRRMLVWMFYLNNAKSGTEFMHFPTVHAKMGRLVIWPSSWTHLHKGVIPNKGLKYIITGWISFNKYEK